MVSAPRVPPVWLDEISAAPGPPFLRMGVRSLSGHWSLGGDDVPRLLAEKGRILAQHHDEAFAALPGTEPAAIELLRELRGGASPEPAGEGSRGHAGDGLHPLDVAGRSVAEDLCLLVRWDEGWMLAAGSVCFPSHWRLTDKLGRPVAEVHGPVPHYAAELSTRVDRFLDRLRVGDGAWRRNWTVHTSDRLFAPTPPPPPDPPITLADAGERLWFRSEHQTLRRLPRTGAIVFTIRTQQVRLGALAGRPGLCHDLADAVTSWPPDLVGYRGGERLRQTLVTWLRHTSSADLT